MRKYLFESAWCSNASLDGKQSPSKRDPSSQTDSEFFSSSICTKRTDNWKSVSYVGGKKSRENRFKRKQFLDDATNIFWAEKNALWASILGLLRVIVHLNFAYRFS